MSAMPALAILAYMIVQPFASWVNYKLNKCKSKEEKREQNIQEAALLTAKLRKWPNKLLYQMTYTFSFKLFNIDIAKLPKYNETLPDPEVITRLSYLLIKLNVKPEIISLLDNIEKNFNLFSGVFNFSVLEPILNNRTFNISPNIKECIELIKNSKIYNDVSIKECIEKIGDDDSLKAGTLLYIGFHEYIETIIMRISKFINSLATEGSSTKK